MHSGLGGINPLTPGSLAFLDELDRVWNAPADAPGGRLARRHGNALRGESCRMLPPALPWAESSAALRDPKSTSAGMPNSQFHQLLKRYRANLAGGLISTLSNMTWTRLLSRSCIAGAEPR